MTTPTPQPRRIKRYGWIPDLPDQRDHLYAAPPEVVAALPSSVDLRDECPEDSWKYDTAEFAVQPPADCYQEAANNKALSYQRVPQTLTSLKGCLAHGHPVVFGFQVYESFESQQVASTGDVPLPSTGEQLLGGHAVMAVGYDDSTSRFLVRNSWGANWGQAGYCTMPYPYLTESNLANDFWTMLQVA